MDNKANFKLTYGLFALFVKNFDFDTACIINTFVQNASDPLTYTVSANKDSLTHAILSKTGKFNISVLSKSVPYSIFEKLGMRSARDGYKLDGIKTRRLSNGILTLDEYSNSAFSLEVKEKVDMGSHTLFIATPTDMQVLSEEESVTYAYYHSDIKPKPDNTKKSGYRCTVCNFVYEGDDIPNDFICPICKHPREDFEKI